MAACVVWGGDASRLPPKVCRSRERSDFETPPDISALTDGGAGGWGGSTSRDFRRIMNSPPTSPIIPSRPHASSQMHHHDAAR